MVSNVSYFQHLIIEVLKLPLWLELLRIEPSNFLSCGSGRSILLPMINAGSPLSLSQVLEVLSVPTKQCGWNGRCLLRCSTQRQRRTRYRQSQGRHCFIQGCQHHRKMQKHIFRAHTTDWVRSIYILFLMNSAFDLIAVKTWTKSLMVAKCIVRTFVSAHEV